MFRSTCLLAYCCRKSFTQGLVIHDGVMYESTGLYVVVTLSSATVLALDMMEVHGCCENVYCSRAPARKPLGWLVEADCPLRDDFPQVRRIHSETVGSCHRSGDSIGID
jgi:hypothetical protein